MMRWKRRETLRITLEVAIQRRPIENQKKNSDDFSGVFFFEKKVSSSLIFLSL